MFVLVAVILLHTFACFYVSLFLVSAFQCQFLHIIFNYNKVAQCVIRGKLILIFDNNDELRFANYLSGFAFTFWTQTVEKNVTFFFHLHGLLKTSNPNTQQFQNKQATTLYHCSGTDLHGSVVFGTPEHLPYGLGHVTTEAVTKRDQVAGIHLALFVTTCKTTRQSANKEAGLQTST